MEDLTEKHIVITGGSTGIGYHVIRKCLEHGATKIAALDIQDADNALANLQTEFPDREIVFLKTDVGDKANVRQSFETAKQRFGHLDVVIGNAGIGDESRPELTVQVNLMGIIHSTYAAIDFMSKSNGDRGGVILNVASVAGLKSMYGAPSYSASKHGVVGFTKAFAHEFYLNKHGLKFITVCPGFTITPLLKKAVLYEVDSDAAAPNLETTNSFQSANEVAVAVLQILRTAEHGSVWQVAKGTTSEVAK